MAWPKKRRLHRAPFLVGLALLVATGAATALGQGDLPARSVLGVAALYPWMALVATLLTWGAWQLVRPAWLRTPLWIGGAALTWGATIVGAMIPGAQA